MKEEKTKWKNKQKPNMRKIKERGREGVCVWVIHWYTNGIAWYWISKSMKMTEHAHTLSLSLFISSSLFHSLFPSSSQSAPAGTLLITNVVKIALMPLMCVYLFIFSNILRLSIRGLIFSIFLYQLLVVHCRQYYYNIVTTVHYCWCPSPFSSFSSIFFSLLLSHAAAEYRISNRIGLLSFVFFSSCDCTKVTNES